MKSEYEIMQGASRLEEVQFSAIRAIMDKAAALREQGRKVISLSAGEPNFNTPEPIKNATMEAIKNNFTHYGSNRGLPKLREIISDTFAVETGVTYNPDDEILFTTGGAEALNNIILAMVNPEDEVIILSPAFVSYKNLVKLCGATCVELPLKIENNFQPDIEDIKNAITPKTKMLIMNNPNNPTGAVYSKEILQEICQLAVENNFLILSDEMYNKLVYKGTFYSVASFPRMKDHAIIVNGFSKTYAMTGWRLGYIFAAKPIIQNILKVHQYSSTCSPTFIQVGMAEAMQMEETKRAVNAMVTEFAERRNLLIERISQIPKITYVEPQGAFYMMINVAGTKLSGTEFADGLLEKEGVAVVPAESLGKADLCKDYIRISFAASKEDIEEGVSKIKKYINSL